MILSAFIVKNTLKITTTSLFLLACNLMNKSAIFEDSNAWQDRGCDTTQKVKDIRIYDIVQPFYENDTLLAQQLKPNAVFVAIADNDESGTVHFTGVQAQGEERPNVISFPNDKNVLPSTWQDQEYLWALASSPHYLYDRWERLLNQERADFLMKRDSVLHTMRQKHGSVRVISDLRSMTNQRKYLKSNRSAAPVSMHNLGLATDFGVIRGGSVSNNFGHYKLLDSLTEQLGMTWGGNFVGFVDPGHIQRYKNGAELVRKFPDLRFEFEPYRGFYLGWMNKMIKAGKEQKAGDTKELLTELNKVRQDKPCPCEKSSLNPPTAIINKAENMLSKVGYQRQTDVLLLADLRSQTLSLITTNGVVTYALGKWR